MDEMGKLVVAFRNFAKAPKKKKKPAVCREFGLVNCTIQKVGKNGTKIICEFEQKGSSENKGISKAVTKLNRRGAAEVVYATKQ